MLIDCDTCRVRGAACAECVVGLLLESGAEGPGAGESRATAAPGGPPPGADADELECRAMRVLADAGFEVTVLQRSDSRPRLRLVSSRRARPAA